MEALFLRDVGLCLCVAALLAILSTIMRQPLVLAYLIAGFLLGPNTFGLISEHSRIELISQIGLVLLMFILGQEIQLSSLIRSRKIIAIPGILQVVLSCAAGWAVFRYFQIPFGIPSGEGHFDLFYLSYAFALSSTTVVVKILAEKFDFETLASRITVGVLVMQDLWAISFLSLQPNFQDPQFIAIAWSMAKGVVLIGGALLLARLVLPIIFKPLIHHSEVYLIVSMGWCFGVTQASESLGLSKEMGALVAGVALSAFPFHVDVASKISSLRDFFITLFFVGLGLRIPLPTPSLVGNALIVSAALIVSRITIVTGILFSMRLGLRTSLIPAINLSQLSEFAPVMLTLGVAFGHVSENSLALVLMVLAMTLAFSSYSIVHAHFITEKIGGVLKRLGLHDIDSASQWEFSDQASKSVVPEIIIYGFFRDASSLLHEFSRSLGEQELREKVMVVGYNPLVHRELKRLGIYTVYGDVGNPDILKHVDLSQVRYVFSTIPDQSLRGTSNLRILRYWRAKLPDAKLFVSAETMDQAVKLYEAGADFVYLSRVHGAKALFQTFSRFESGEGESIKEYQVHELTDRDEILP